MIQLGDEYIIHYKGLSWRLRHLIDECHNQQNIFCVYRLSDDKTFVLLNWTVKELRLNWTESFETPLLNWSVNFKKLHFRIFSEFHYCVITFGLIMMWSVTNMIIWTDGPNKTGPSWGYRINDFCFAYQQATSWYQMWSTDRQIFFTCQKISTFNRNPLHLPFFLFFCYLGCR